MFKPIFIATVTMAFAGVGLLVGHLIAKTTDAGPYPGWTCYALPPLVGMAIGLGIAKTAIRSA